MRWLNQLKGMLGGLAQGGSLPASQTPQPRRPTPIAEPEIPVAQRGLRALVEADLCRLNAGFPGLGDAAACYVLTGGNPEVLRRLESSGLGRRIEAQGAFAHRGTMLRGRYYVLGIELRGEPELCCRYVQVLTASLATGYDRPAALPGVPLTLQDYLGNLTQGLITLTGKDSTYVFKDSFNTDTLFPFAKRLGATTTDLLVALYTVPSRYASSTVANVRGHLDREALLLTDPAALSPAAQRMNEVGRIALLEDISAGKLESKEPGLGLVMDLAGNNLKAVREAALKTVATLDPTLREAEALKRLKSGDATKREAMAGILVSLGTPTARAALEAHLPGERAAAVRAVIESTTKAMALRSTTAEADDAAGYVALGGVRFDLPPLRPFRPHDGTTLGPEEGAELRTAFGLHLARQVADEAVRIAKYPKSTPKSMPKAESIDSLLAFLNGDWEEKGWRTDYLFRRFVNEGDAKAWTNKALARLSQETGLRFALCIDDYVDTLLSGYRRASVSATVLVDYAASPEGDLRQIMRLIKEHGLSVRHGSSVAPGAAFLSGRIRQDRYDRGEWLNAYPAEYLWPWVAENLNALDQALQPAQLSGATDILKVLAVLRLLPATPERFVAPLLDHACGTRRDGRADARLLVARLPKLDEHLAGMLADKRQAVRAAVADWLATARRSRLSRRWERRWQRKRQPSRAPPCWGRCAGWVATLNPM
ncbi:MAG: hypothetical protein HC844_15315 [Tabrizicola sp.]|nr:hypothetical protein [Tabrizicola sp.]